MSNSRLYGKMLVIESAAALATDLGLSLADMLVLIRLVSLYNRDCGYAWPGKKKLAAELGITVRQVNRSINRLVAAKVLAVTRGGGKHSQTNRYVPAPAISTTPFEDAAAKRERVTKQSSVQELRTRTTDDRAVPTDDRAVTPQMTAPSSKPSYSSSYKNPSDLPSAQCSKHCADTVISSQTDGEFLRRVERLLPSYQNGNLYNGKAVTVRRFFERCCEIFDGHDVDDPLAQWANRLAGKLQQILEQNGRW